MNYKVKLIEASAGSGKTYTLTHQYYNIITNNSYHNNDISNILAITFTNNAAYEMKERIITKLKEEILNNNNAKIEFILNEILNRYTDFKITTIDSFINLIFSSSAIYLNVPSDYVTITEHSQIIEEVLLNILKKSYKDKKIIKYLEDFIKNINQTEQNFTWNPFAKIQHKISKFITMSEISNNEIQLNDYMEQINLLYEQMLDKLENLIQIAQKNSIQLKKNIVNNFYTNLKKEKMKNIIENKNTVLLNPTTKGKENTEIKQMGKEIFDLHLEYLRYYLLNSVTKYKDILNIFFKEYYNYRQKNSIFHLNDINNILREYMSPDKIPEIYFTLSDKIYYFFIDEFQDTNLIQWNILKPLIEEALSKNGALFAVGDIKQAIYMFRNADYKIMKQMKEEIQNNYTNKQILPESANEKLILEQLDKNYRSGKYILDYVKTIFNKDKFSDNELIKNIFDYNQKHIKENGYVNVRYINKNDEDLEDKFDIFYEPLMQILEDIKNRYNYKDITILCSTNEQVEKIITWLIDNNYPAASFSSLDIRKRKIINEIIKLLQFLDYPLDNNSFAQFLLSDVFKTAIQKKYNINSNYIENFISNNLKYNKILYLTMQDDSKLSILWKEYFEQLMKKTGYISLYELATNIIYKFDILKNFKEETSFITKFLDVINNFEYKTSMNIKKFIKIFFDYNSFSNEFSIILSKTLDAINVMTAHKSKGLGFPVVINIVDKNITNSKQSKKIFYYQENGKIIPYEINKKIYEKIQSLQELKDEIHLNNFFTDLITKYNQEKLSSQLQDYNLQYVAATRAKDELYILFSDEQNIQFFMPDDSSNPYEIGKKRRSEKDTITKNIINDFKYPNQTTNYFSPKNKITKKKMENTEKGNIIHNILSQIVYIDDKIDTQILNKVNKIYNNFFYLTPKEEIIKTLQRFFENEKIKKFFTPEQNKQIFNEISFVDKNGNIIRIDKLIVIDKNASILEFKTGEKNKLEYEKQLSYYIETVRETQKYKTVKGYLIYFDKKEVEIYEY